MIDTYMADWSPYWLANTKVIAIRERNKERGESPHNEWRSEMTDVTCWRGERNLAASAGLPSSRQVFLFTPLIVNKSMLLELY